MRRFSVLELFLAALCLWGAAWHTPLGALVRGAGARVVGMRSSARPLLAYYGGGVYAGRAPAAAPLALAGPVPPAQAMGYGLAAVLGELDEEERAPLALPAQPAQLTTLLSALRKRLGSDEAAVLALFCGEEPARYAKARAEAENDDPDLEDLARQLPPRYEEQIALASQALMLGQAYALSWPLPEAVRITSPYGMREHPTLGTRKLHAGVDLGVPIGTLVRASGDGIVRRASSDAQNGRILVVDHGRGVVTLYCHNDVLLVRDGEHVARGQAISRSGNSGRSTGPHLHYQLDLQGTPVDPLRYRAPRHKPTVAGASD